MTASAQLHDFEGRPVHRATVKIVGAGDGLSEALSIKPDEILEEEDRYFVLRAKCGRVAFETNKDGIRSRVHTMKASDITMVEEDIAQRFLTAAADNLARAKADAEGQLELAADEDLEGKIALAEMNEGNGLSPEFKEPTA